MAADYCYRQGIAYEEFMSWGDVSRDVALAVHVREQERCGGCGTVASDWRAYDDDGLPILDSAGHHAEAMTPAFLVDGRVCRGCEARDAAAKTDDAKRPGWKFFFRRNPDKDD